MVVGQDHVYRHDGSQHSVDASMVAPRKKSGLVSSRVSFFEEKLGLQPNHHEAAYTTGAEHYHHRSAYTPKEEPAYRQPHLHAAPAAPLDTREPVSPPSCRRRYPDSFSTDLPIIAETRQENFQGTLKKTAKKKSSPLVEAGLDHYSRQEYIMAEKAFKTALKTEHANGSEDKMQTALVMGNLGAVYLKQNKLEDANHFLEASLNLKKSIGPNVVMSDTYNNLGNCNYLMGRLDRSLDFYRLALQELREKKGDKSDVADILFNIGRLEIYRENWKTARDILHEASRMAKDAYSENSLYIAEASDLMGFVQLTLGETAEAIVSFTKALEIHRSLHGPLHVDIANAIFNIGLTREAAGEYSEAWEAYNTALDLHRKLGSSLGDPDFKKVRTSVAMVEKLIAQQQNQARLVQKHKEAIKKKKKPKDKQVH
jgi:tetratricopeptide (TPR) repeat protein